MGICPSKDCPKDGPLEDCPLLKGCPSIDCTAQGLARARDCEAKLPREKQLFYDPYAYAMYQRAEFWGEANEHWMENKAEFLHRNRFESLHYWMGMEGPLQLASIRTRWFDDQIEVCVEEKGAKQLIILRAGYDTRGFRFELPDNFKVWEVDQLDIQKKKIDNLQRILDSTHRSIRAIDRKTIVERLISNQVEFVPVNFNLHALDQRLKAQERFQSNLPSVIILEAVSQYICKRSTADTLKRLKTVVASGSYLLISYVKQECLYADSSYPEAFQKIKAEAKKINEPWVSGWTKPGFEKFLKDCGYEIIFQENAKECNSRYLEPLEREAADQDRYTMERFVVARVL